MPLHTRILREPLVHFLVIGLLLFGVFAAISDPEDVGPDRDAVVVTDAEISQIIAQFSQTWRRAPTVDELNNLVAAFIREEVLVQEALSLSMDAGDPVVRRRLAQKMQFVIESGAGALVPTEEDLRAQYASNIEAYSSNMEMAFEQVFLGQSPSQREVDDLLDALQNNAPPAELGQRTLLPTAVELSPQQAVDNVFGAGFFTVLAEAETGKWIAPVQSGYGFHVVRVTDRVNPLQRPYEDVLDRLEIDWRARAGQELSDLVFDEIAARYSISAPSRDQLDRLLQ